LRKKNGDRKKYKLCQASDFKNQVDANTSGTDAMISKIFSPKNLAKISTFFAQNTAIFAKI
jgi:hypothetical protein